MNGSSDYGDKIQGLLDALRQNDSEAMSELMPLVYPGLRKQARRILSGEYGGRTLQTTELVHEAYLDMVEGSSQNWQNQTHFFRVAAVVMRHILIQHARKRMSLKRGGRHKIVSADDEDNVTDFETAAGVFDFEKEEDLVRLDAALDKLAAVDRTKAEIVEKRFFLGLTVEQTAEDMNISPPTVKRKWQLAKAWLYREMTR